MTYLLSKDGTLSDNSDFKNPSEKAVKTYVDNSAIPCDTDSVSSAGISTTTANTYQTKATLTFTPEQTGNYEISFYCSVSNEEKDKDTFMRLYDSTGTTTLAEQVLFLPDKESEGIYLGFGGSVVSGLTASVSQTFTLDWHGETAGKITYIKQAYIVAKYLA